MALVKSARRGQSVLLVAPTGGGKTLAGFLPSLMDLADHPQEGLHTLYISPLKALAVDVHRNLTAPIEDIGLPISHETRTGDTPASKKARQRKRPPNMLLTTPESLALMLSHADAARTFRGLRAVILDEIHALSGNKRGDLLSLGVARLKRLAPDVRVTGLSATVADPEELRLFVDPEAEVLTARGGRKAKINVLNPRRQMPWGGHMALYTMPDLYKQITQHTTTLVFVNTRATAEIVFQRLWKLNDDGLPIALHHGSLAAGQRRKVEAAMAEGKLRAVVATSSLDLGIDWASVDLVIQVGAPKGTARMIQRIGRANHRINEASKALLAPGNRFEVLECLVAKEAIADGLIDSVTTRPGGLDVLSQHIMGMACAGAVHPDDLYEEVIGAAPYRHLSRADFDDAMAFVENGGYALKAYDKYAKLKRDDQGRLKSATAMTTRQYRMNVGTIVGAETTRLRVGRRVVGEVEEYFLASLEPGDTFMFAGQILKFEGMRDGVGQASKAAGAEPKVPHYVGGRMSITSMLAERMMDLLNSPDRWAKLPRDVKEWLTVQQARSLLPKPGTLLVETFPRGQRQFTVAYGFAGRNAHQTLGMLLTKRMLRRGERPIGFVANDYAIAVWSLKPVADVEDLFDTDLLGDDLEEWITESNLLKRTFRNCAVIAGLIERRHPGQEKTGRQVTFNSDLIYDVLRKHEPNHILLRATRADASTGLIDLERLSALLHEVQGNIIHQPLDRVSPLAIPVLLDIGKEVIGAPMIDDLLGEASDSLVAEAMRVD